jgi:hypothetical protein
MMKRRAKGVPYLLIGLGVLISAAGLIGLYRSQPGMLSSLLANQETEKITPVERMEPTFKSLTNRGGHEPKFDSDGHALHYITPSGELGYIAPLSREAEGEVLMNLPPQARLKWNQHGTQALVKWQVSPEGKKSMGVLERRELSIATLADEAWDGAWTPGYTHMTFVKIEDDEIGLWQRRVGGKRATLLTDLSDVVAPDYVAWSALGNRILIQGAVGVAIYAVEDNVATEINWIPWAQEATWSPDGWTISFRRHGSELDAVWVGNFDGNALRPLWEGVFSQVRWLPDGRLIYFTPGREGGATCWAQDPHTGSRELLADTSIIVWKPVDTFDVSPRGDMLAFEAQDRQIWLLELP